jgi:UDP-N-acetylmuramoyl-tripeptide--D-alanyl-D-alanine ligase
VSVRLAVEDLVAATGGRLVVPPGSAAPAAVTGVTTDSRTAAPGDLFVALRGTTTDGHRFVEDAAARGAVLALVSEPTAARGRPAIVVDDTLQALGAVAALWRRQLTPIVVGITGSVGKTTTVAMTAHVLERRFRVARTAEAWNAELGVPLALLGLRPDHEVAVLEMAMRGRGQLRALAAMARPQLGVVTLIGDTHLELLGSREAIAAAKAELLESLPEDGVAIVNADDPWTPRVLRDVRCRVLRAGLGPDAEIRAGAAAPTDGGMRFTLHGGGAQAEVLLPLPGRHQVQNAVLAAAVGVALGLPLAEVAAGLGRVRPPTMRQQVVVVDDVLVIDDSYNASPQSMQAALEVLAQVGGTRRRVLVLGEMRELGPRAHELHRDVGRAAAAVRPAVLLAVGHAARGYVEGALAAGMPADALVWVPDVESALPLVRGAVRPGDAVLIKGSRAVAMERLVAGLGARQPAGSP